MDKHLSTNKVFFINTEDQGGERGESEDEGADPALLRNHEGKLKEAIGMTSTRWPAGDWAKEAYETYAPAYDDFNRGYGYEYERWTGVLLEKAEAAGMGGSGCWTSPAAPASAFFRCSSRAGR